MLRGALTLLILPLLPADYRRRWPWPSPVPEGWWDALTVYLHASVALVVFIGLFITYQQQAGEMVSAAVASEQGGGEVGRITWYGTVTFFAFFFSPMGLLSTLFLTDSAVRMIHRFGTNEPMGSVFLWVPLRLWDGLRSLGREGRMTARYGPASAPDRLTAEGQGLIVRTSRPRPEWSPDHAYVHGGRFFRLGRWGEEGDGARRCFAYRFEPWPERDTVRRVVHLGGGSPAPPPKDGPGPGSTGTGRTEGPASSQR